MNSSLSGNFDAEWEALINGTDITAPEITKISNLPNSESKGKERLYRGETVLSSSGEEENESRREESGSESGEAEDNAAILEAVGSTFNTLILQVDELREKYLKESDARKRVEITNKKLMVQLASLAEENAEMQDALKNKVESRNRGSISGPSGRRNKRLTQIDTSNNPEQNIQLALMQGEDDDFAIGFDEGVKTKSNIFSRLSVTVYGMMPFEKDVRVIQASFGGAVAAYFKFFRWMIFNWVIVAVTGSLFAILHIVRMTFRGDAGSMLVGTGILPGFMEYSSFRQTEKFIYTANVLLVLFVLVIMCVQKVISEDKLMKRLDLIENENDFTFSKDVLGGWDHSISQSTEVTDLHGLLKQVYREKLAELQLLGLRKARTNLKILELYARRLAGSVVYLAVQIASYSAIVYLTVKSQEIQNGLQVGALKSLSQFIVPAAVTAINSATPGLYKALTMLELWDSGQVQLNILLSRMYISNMMNLVILALSYALLADPFLFAGDGDKAIRLQVEHDFNPNSTCRLDQAANGLFSLILTEFFLNGMVFLGMGGFNVFVNAYVMPFPKKEFNIAQRMVAMLYFVSLMTLTFPFSPLTVVIHPFMLAARIKWEKYVTLKFYAKPKTVWTAHKAGTFFVVFYIMSLTFVALPTAVYFLSRESFPKSCDIQDDYPELCASEIAADNTCTVDDKSTYYSLYSDETYCEGGYPACICDYACGPFVHEHTAFAAFRKTIQGVVIAQQIWEYIFKNSYGAWFLACFFYILSRLRRNTIGVNSQGFKEKERGLETHITALENEKKKHEKLINRLKLLDAPAATEGVLDMNVDVNKKS